jgi:hypothetical protein
MDRLDAEVHERLKLREKEVSAVLTRRERELLLLTGHILGDHAIHVVDEQSFQLDYPPDGLDVEAGLYRIGGPSVHSEHRYDLHHHSHSIACSKAERLRSRMVLPYTSFTPATPKLPRSRLALATRAGSSYPC